VAERLREIANVANLVGIRSGRRAEVVFWFELADPMLGNISPSNLIRIGRIKRLHAFVVAAREAENATSP
jgi:hypothetical protein